MSISLWIFGCLLPLPFIVEVNFFSVNVGQSPSKAVQNGGTGTQIPLGRDFWRHCIIVLKRKATIVTNVREHSMNGHLLDQRGMDVDILEADCYLPELIELLISQLNIWLLPEHFKLIAVVWGFEKWYGHLIARSTSRGDDARGFELFHQLVNFPRVRTRHNNPDEKTSPNLFKQHKATAIGCHIIGAYKDLKEISL